MLVRNQAIISTRMKNETRKYTIDSSYLAEDLFHACFFGKKIHTNLIRRFFLDCGKYNWVSVDFHPWSFESGNILNAKR
jgi:hypothetical protein